MAGKTKDARQPVPVKRPPKAPIAPVDEDPDDEDLVPDELPDKKRGKPAAKPRQAPRPRRFLRFVMLSLPFLATGGVWCAPIVLSQPMIAEQVLPCAIPGFAGHIALGGASLGWFSPIELRDVEVRDEQGDLLFHAARISNEKTLLDLVTGYPHLGTFDVERPELRIAVRADGSNLEDAFAGLLNSDSSSKSDGGSSDVEVTLHVTEGIFEFFDVAEGRKQRLEDVSLTLEQGGDAPGLKLAFQAANSGLGGGAVAEGRVELQLESRTADGDASLHGSEHEEGHDDEPDELRRPLPTAQIQSHRVEQQDAAELAEAADEQTVGTQVTHWHAELKANHFDVGGLDPLLARFAPGTHVEAELDGQLTVSWTVGSESPQVHIEGRMAARDMAIQSPRMHSTERVRLPAVELSGHLDWRDHRLEVQQFALKSELASLETTGTIGTAFLFKPLSLDEALASLGDEDFRCDGDLDLAKVMAFLPRTLRIRDEVQVDSGTLSLIVESRKEGARWLWLGQVSTSHLAGKVDGQPLAIDKPIEITFSGHLENGNATLDRLLCKSTFVQLLVSGREEQGKVQARCDLDGLLRELQRYVDLGQVHAAGRVHVKCEWRIPATGTMQMQVQAMAEQFALSIPGHRPMRETRLDFVASAKGEAPDAGVRKLDECIMQLTSGGDRCLAELQQPVDIDDRSSTWPFKMEIEGELASWLARLQVWVPFTGWDLRGLLQGETMVHATRESIACDGLQVQLQQFAAISAGYHIQEPQLRLDAGGLWNLKEQRLTIPSATLAGSALSVRAKDLSYSSTATGGPEMSGKLGIRADLARVGAWTQSQSGGEAARLAGVAKGVVSLAQTGSHLQWNVQLTGDNVAFVSGTPEAGAPPAVGVIELTAAGQYERDSDTWGIEKFDLTSDGARISGTGHVASSGGPQPIHTIDLSGQIAYDLERLLDRFRGAVGPNVHWTGRDSRAFSLRGPLTAAASPVQTGMPTEELTGQAGIGWTAAQVFGLAIGPGELNLTLANGAVQAAPLDLAVAEGRLKLAPRVVFASTPAVLELNRGPMIEHMRLSPQLCAGWLKFVAPMVAEATHAEGTFSLNLNGGSFPLSNPKAGDTGGNLLIHSAQLRPAAMGDQFLAVARQVQTILKLGSLSSTTPGDFQVNISNQNVEFRMTQGRVYHRGLEFHAGRITIRTSGSVGFDETVSLVAEVPVLDDWIGNNRLLAGMKGQVLRIPIVGTLKAPQMDPSALGGLTQQLAGQAIESAVQGAVQDAVGKGLGNIGKGLGDAGKGLGGNGLGDVEQQLQKLLPF